MQAPELCRCRNVELINQIACRAQWLAVRPTFHSLSKMDQFVTRNASQASYTSVSGHPSPTRSTPIDVDNEAELTSISTRLEIQASPRASIASTLSITFAINWNTIRSRDGVLLR